MSKKWATERISLKDGPLSSKLSPFSLSLYNYSFTCCRMSVRKLLFDANLTLSQQILYLSPKVAYLKM